MRMHFLKKQSVKSVHWKSTNFGSIVSFSQISTPRHWCALFRQDRVSEFSTVLEKVMMTIWPTGSFRCSLEHKTGSCVCGEEEKSKLSAVMTNMWMVSSACVDIICVSGFRGGRGLRAGGAIFPLPSFWKHRSSSPLSGETINLSFLSVLVF